MFLIENLGSESYFTALKHVSFLMGNTSSGIIEAASFGKYVLNLGNRQLGRTSGNNVMHVPIHPATIISKIKEIENAPALDHDNIYWNGDATETIVNLLKEFKNNQLNDL